MSLAEHGCRITDSIALGIAAPFISVLIYFFNDIKVFQLSPLPVIQDNGKLTIHPAVELTGVAFILNRFVGTERHLQLNHLRGIIDGLSLAHLRCRSTFSAARTGGFLLFCVGSTDPAHIIRNIAVMGTRNAGFRHLNVVDPKLIILLAVCGYVIRNNTDSGHLAVVLIRTDLEALRCTGAKPVPHELLVSQLKAAGAILKEELEVEQVLGSGIAVSSRGDHIAIVVRRHSVVIDIDRDRIGLADLCEVKVLHGLLIADLIVR